ncbi:MAG: TFIIB-type zinc ribbon-containing protein [Clostridia bacterium]|nr:TFIIB-type zinc ribbon-containing protein [Clostridia bacterium]
MAGVTYKCPSCGAYLNFEPDSQKWKCPFCDSVFAEDALADKEEQYQAEADAEEAAQQPEEAAEEQSAQETAEDPSQQVTYRCQSCGSEIMTDETTVATHCYYCHNPVVLQGKLTADMRPDKVLPFAISKEKAVEKFMEWVGKKKYVPADFFSKAQVEMMSGVYYPHFVNSATVDAAFSGTGTNTSTSYTMDYIITKTDYYQVERRGRIRFGNIMRPALKKVNKKLADGIHPFPLEKAKDFSGAYLSGFLAERRDMDASEYTEDIRRELEKYSSTMLRETAHYGSLRGDSSVDMRSMDSQYVLLPTWVLTYPNKNKPDDPYYYAMNGCTGEICGKLPIDKGKLWRKGLFIGLLVFAIALLASYFLF